MEATPAELDLARTAGPRGLALEQSLFVLALAAVSIAIFRGTGPVDDDFIIYRYARNWLDGHGPVFNAGERVEGYSQPLWLMLVTLAMGAGLEGPVAGTALSLASAAVAVLATASAWQRIRPQSRWPVPALLLAASPAFAWHAVAGLGTVLLAALLALWLAAYLAAKDEDRSLAVPSLLIGLACLARTEAIAWLVFFLLCERRARRPVCLLLALAPPAAWVVFRLAFYERAVPVTYAVKKLPFWTDLAYGLRYFGKSTLETGFGLLLVLAIPLLFSRRSEPVSKPLRACLLGSVLYTAFVVYVGGDYMALARFFVSALPLALVLGCAGAFALLRSAPRTRVAAAALAFVLLQWPLLSMRAAVAHDHRSNEERWIVLGREFARRMPPGTKVALAAIGAVGYHSRLPIVDMLGLTNEAILHAEPDLSIEVKSHQRYDAGWVLSQRPDVVILANGQLEQGENGRPTLPINAWERSLLEHPAFAREYVSVTSEIEGSYPLICWIRRDFAAPEGFRRI